MEPAEIISQTIETMRTMKNVEFRMAANEHPEQTMTLDELAAIVDAAFEEVSQALIEALDSEGQDEAARWWGEPEPGPYGIFFKGGLPEQGYLPRAPTASSWWDGCP